MVEKLEYGRRCFVRMREAKQRQDLIDLQDHFWGLVAARGQIWYYFGRWVGEKKKPERLIQRWQSRLAPPDAQCWSHLLALRIEDVHVKPVTVRSSTVTEIVVVDSIPVTVDDKPIVATETFYRVECNGTSHDVFSLSQQGLALLERFISEFDQLGPQS